MSAVLCLPACLRVSAAASHGQAPNGNASVARSRQKEKRRNRTSSRDQTTTIPTRRRKKRIRSKYWRPSRSASGQPPLTSMQAPNLVRNSRGGKRRPLPVLLPRSSRPRVLVPCHLVVLLPPQVGQVRWQEAWVPGWLRLLDRRRNQSPLTQVFCFFLQSCMREASRTPLRRECNYMPLRACTFLPRFYLSVCMWCTSRPVLLPSVHNCFRDLECARPRALRYTKKQFISQDKHRCNWRPAECHFGK